MTSGGAGRQGALRVVEPPREAGEEGSDPLHHAIAALDHPRPPGDVLRSLPAAVVGLGFDRALLTAGDRRADADAVLAVGPRLAGRPRRVDLRSLSFLFGDAARSRSVALVTDRQRCSAVAALFDEHEVVPGYVLVPVVVHDECVAVLYADTARCGVVPGSALRDRLATFALVAGHLVGEAALRELVARADSSQRHAGTHAADSGARSADGGLTGREIEVVSLMAAGRTNAQIGRQLAITEGTVKSHVKGVFRKLRAANRAEAVARWLATRPDPTRHSPVHPPTATPLRETSAAWN